MNTQALMPFEAIAINEVIDPSYPEHPGLCGTGFFCFFPPYEHIFYVTARHCLEFGSVKSTNDLSVRYSNTHKEYVRFSQCLSTSYSDDATNEDDLEDVLVYRVSDDIGAEKKSLLKKRALRLIHQEDVDSLIAGLSKPGMGKVRTIGFPRGADEANQIDYGSDMPQIISQPRGFNGYLRKKGTLENRFMIEELNWASDSFDGFSGAPVLALQPHTPAALENPTRENVAVIVLGVILTASANSAHFLSINVVTDLIASGINSNFEEKPRL